MVYSHVVWLEAKASALSISVMFVLALLGLDLTLGQWGFMLLGMPFCVAAYMIPDFYLLARHFRPIGIELARLDRGATPTHAEASAAIGRALNLPLFCFLRINLVHGPLATISILIAFEIINFSFDAGFALWQKAIFAGTAMLFAAPTHAMVEFFSLTRDMAGPIARLSQFSNDDILPEHRSRLVSIRLRSKLFYLSIFIAGVPLVFFGVSTGFKVDHMLCTNATAFNIDQVQMLPLWRCIAGVVGLCLILSLAMIIFTAAEASHLYATLSGAMRRAQAGNLDADLHITSTDEHADLFRGFNHMSRCLREQVQLLEVLQELAGELKLDAPPSARRATLVQTHRPRGWRGRPRTAPCEHLSFKDRDHGKPRSSRANRYKSS